MEKIVLIFVVVIALTSSAVGDTYYHYYGGLDGRSLADDDTLSYPSPNVVAAPASAPYANGHELLGLAGINLGLDYQSAPQWVLSFYLGFTNPDLPVTLQVGGLDEDIFGTTSFAHALHDSTPIGTFPFLDVVAPVSLDVTAFMHTLAATQYGTINPEFVVRALENAASSLVVLNASLESRDGSKEYPFLPGLSGHFENLPTGHVFDPAAAPGFVYQMTDGSLFTRAYDFPEGFTDPFTVSVEGQVIGQFAAGESVDFTSFPGGGVSSFTVSGISPAVDPKNPLAFPLGLEFNTPTASFDMIAIPEPSGCLLAGAGSVGLLLARRRGRRRLVCRN